MSNCEFFCGKYDIKINPFKIKWPFVHLILKQANFETLWKIASALDMRPSELVALIESEIEQDS